MQQRHLRAIELLRADRADKRACGGKAGERCIAGRGDDRTIVLNGGAMVRCASTIGNVKLGTFGLLPENCDVSWF